MPANKVVQYQIAQSTDDDNKLLPGVLARNMCMVSFSCDAVPECLVRTCPVPVVTRVKQFPCGGFDAQSTWTAKVLGVNAKCDCDQSAAVLTGWRHTSWCTLRSTQVGPAVTRTFSQNQILKLLLFLCTDRPMSGTLQLGIPATRVLAHRQHADWTWSSPAHFCAGKFFWYVLFIFLTLAFFTFYGMMTVSLVPNIQASPFSMLISPACLQRTLSCTLYSQHSLQEEVIGLGCTACNPVDFTWFLERICWGSQQCSLPQSPGQSVNCWGFSAYSDQQVSCNLLFWKSKWSRLWGGFCLCVCRWHP